MDIGVNIKSYHTKNSILKAKRWVEAFQTGGQGFTVSGINAHHQNGMTDRRIMELQELICKMLIHANMRWSKAVTENLWSYEFPMDNNRMNETLNFQNPDKNIPQAIFSGSQLDQNSNH